MHGASLSIAISVGRRGGSGSGRRGDEEGIRSKEKEDDRLLQRHFLEEAERQNKHWCETERRGCLRRLKAKEERLAELEAVAGEDAEHEGERRPEDGEEGTQMLLLEAGNAGEEEADEGKERPQRLEIQEDVASLES